jgi:hypothetical protein
MPQVAALTSRPLLFTALWVVLAIGCDGTSGARDGGDVGTISTSDAQTTSTEASSAGAQESSTTAGTTGPGGTSGSPGGGTGGDAATNTASTAGADGGGGADAAGDTGSPDASVTDRCANSALVWKTARKTNYISYPDPGSEECVVYNGCMWAGWFAGCSDQQSETWVSEHNLAAMFPNFGDLAHHEVCIRSGDHAMIVNVIDTCGDSDCGGCCTSNQGDTDALVDLESHTNARWGLQDGEIEWADLGPNPSPVCD